MAAPKNGTRGVGACPEGEGPPAATAAETPEPEAAGARARTQPLTISSKPEGQPTPPARAAATATCSGAVTLAAEGRRGGTREAPPAWNVPAELAQIDPTEMEEDLRLLVKGPDKTWLQDHHQARREASVAAQSQAESEAADLAQRWQSIATSPMVEPLKEASDQRFAYAVSRLAHAEGPAAPLEAILSECTYSACAELAEEAARVLDTLPRVGEERVPTVALTPPTWTGAEEGPGRGTLTMFG